MRNCPKCNEPVKGKTKFCPSCGEKLGRRTAEEKKSRLTEQKKSSKALLFIVAGLVVAGALAFGALNLSKTPTTTVVGGDYISSGSNQPSSADDRTSSRENDTADRSRQEPSGSTETAARSSQEPSQSTETAARREREPSRAAETVTFALSEFEDGRAKYYTYKGPGGKNIKFFILKSSDGVIRAAFDACDVCYQSRKGYRKEGDFMVCNNCGQRFTSVRINEVRGGCNPAPLERKVVGDKLVIAVADIIPGARYF